MPDRTFTDQGSESLAQHDIQQVIRLYSEGNLQEALALIELLQRSFPDSDFLYNIRGASHVGLGQTDAAISSYQRALAINPKDGKTHFNIGNAWFEKGDLGAAIESYKNALQLDPNYIVAYVNLGNALLDSGDLQQAINSYLRALDIEPDHVEVLNNLGIAYRKTGDLEPAIHCFRRAVHIHPDYGECHNNLGNVMKDKGETDKAIESYEHALRVNPEYVDAAWNMVGTARTVTDARKGLERCLAIDSEYQSARLNLDVLDFYRSESRSLEVPMRPATKDHPIARSLEWVSKLPALPELHFNRWAFFDRVIELSERDRPFYEFGVFKGQAFEYLIAAFGRGFGFDTFEGLPEDWHDEKAGSYSSDGAIPRIAGGKFIAGKFEDTLPGFFSEPRELASVINFDADLYSSTICALNNAKSVMDSSTILIFDEFIVNDHWEQDEYRALNEFCLSYNCKYEVLAISFITKQAAFRLVGL